MTSLTSEETQLHAEIIRKPAVLACVADASAEAWHVSCMCEWRETLVGDGPC